MVGKINEMMCYYCNRSKFRKVRSDYNKGFSALQRTRNTHDHYAVSKKKHITKNQISQISRNSTLSYTPDPRGPSG